MIVGGCHWLRNIYMISDTDFWLNWSYNLDLLMINRKNNIKIEVC